MSQTKAQLISDLVQALNFAGTSTAPATGLFCGATNEVALATDSTARLTVDGDGRVLVGTTSSSSDVKLVVSGKQSSATAAGTLLVQRGESVSSTDTVLGNIFFSDSDGDRGCQIEAASDGAWASDDYPGSLRFKTTADSGSSPTERMRIDSSGNIGINTSSPDSLIHARKSDFARLRLEGTNSTGTRIVDVVGESNSTEVWRLGKLSSSSSDFQINVGGTERMSISSGGTVAITDDLTVNGSQYPTAGALSNRNLIINGAMQVAQRGTSVTGIGVDDYTCADRFKHFAALAGQAGRLTATQETITDLDGFHKALKLQVTTTETPGSTESYGLNTRLEMQDIKGLGVGTSGSVPLTLTFYAKAPTGNGVFCAGIIMPGGGSYIEEVTINTSWSRHEINIPATTNSAHATTQTNDTHSGMEIQITLMAGSSRNDHGNGTWEADTNNRATSNQSNFFSSTSNNLFITGVQLERGEKATPFEHRSHADDLAKCQRYFLDPAGVSGDSSGTEFIQFNLGQTGTGSNEYIVPVSFPVTMRAAPTVTVGSNDFGEGVWNTLNPNGNGRLDATTSGTKSIGTTGCTFKCRDNTDSSHSGFRGWFYADAEL